MPIRISRKSRSRIRQQKLEFESLEQRQLMACDDALTSALFNSPMAGALMGNLASVRSTTSTASQPLSATAVDDAFEENDTWATASDLGTVAQSKTIDKLVADSADWFRFKLGGLPNSSAAISLSFQNAQGDLDLAVYSSDGRRIGNSAGTGNSERVSLAGLTTTSFYVQVYGYRGIKNPNYSMTINPGQAVADDIYEPNNSLATAANLGSLAAAKTVSNLVMADAQDWYQFQVNGTGSNTRYVGINFNNSRGDLDLEVLDSTGRRVGLSDGVTNSERVSLNTLGSGTYYVRVYGYRGALNPNYQLIVDPGVPEVPTNPTNPTPPNTSAFNIQLNATGLTATQRAIFNNAAARWEQIIVGDLPSVTFQGRVIDDLSIDVSARSIDGAGGVLGQAAADRFRSGSQLPYHGFAEFDSADLAQMEANGTLFSVVLHEIGHVLGIGTLWQRLGLVSGAGTSNPLFTGRQATAEYNTLTGTTSRGIPVENSGGSGTADAHWRESIFTGELMTGYIGPGTRLPLSRVTVASLADLGYQVNINAADAYRLS
jgi:hypothetical protein